MMLKRKSSPWAQLKYLFVLPLAAVAVAAFARPEISHELEKISSVKISEIVPIKETIVEKKLPGNLVESDVIKQSRSEKEKEIAVQSKDSIENYKEFLSKYMEMQQAEIAKIVEERQPEIDMMIKEKQGEIEKIIEDYQPEMEKMIKEREAEIGKIIEERQQDIEKEIMARQVEIEKIMEEQQPEMVRMMREEQAKRTKIMEENRPEIEKIINKARIEIHKIQEEYLPEINEMVKEKQAEIRGLMRENLPELEKMARANEIEDEIEELIKKHGVKLDQLIKEREIDLEKQLQGKLGNISVVGYPEASFTATTSDDIIDKPFRFPSLNSSEPKPLLIVDDEEMDYSQLEKIPHSSIQSISVLKNDYAVSRYGDKARAGVMLVTTKRYID